MGAYLCNISTMMLKRKEKTKQKIFLDYLLVLFVIFSGQFSGIGKRKMTMHSETQQLHLSHINLFVSWNVFFLLCFVFSFCFF